MELLPKWILTNPAPALYDAESGTAIEMVAKVYGAMNTLISEFNKMVDDVNSQIIKHKNSTEIDIDSFKTCVTSTIENYIKSIENKTDRDKNIRINISYLADFYLTLFKEMKGESVLQKQIIIDPD